MTRVIIILPARNEEANISNCLLSIIGQTVESWECIVIDDGSTDATSKKVEKFLIDKRIRLIRNEKSIGLAASLNKGISLSKTNLICRMDADDLMNPRRLEFQLKFMSANADVAILGTAAVYHSSGKYWLVKMPSKNPQDQLLKGKVPVIHPTVLFNREILGNDLKYNEASKRAEDLDLWYSLYGKYKFANIDYPSIIYNDVPKRFIRTIIDNWRVKAQHMSMINALRDTIILSGSLFLKAIKNL